MSVISMKQLLEAGVHFGHQTRRWNPKMAKYIFIERNGIYIVDLQQTTRQIDEAYAFVKEIIADGGTALFVGTKKQAQEAIEQEAKRCGQFYVSQRWLGGMLTNFKTIRKRIDVLFELEKMEKDGTFEKLPKKEVLELKKKKDRLEKFLSGVKHMNKLPDVVFVVDPKKEAIAIHEARVLGIPVVAIVDTNCDPDDVDIVIPGNDDAIRSVKLITTAISSAVLEGKQGVQEDDYKEEVAEETAEVAETEAETKTEE